MHAFIRIEVCGENVYKSAWFRVVAAFLGIVFRGIARFDYVIEISLRGNGVKLEIYVCYLFFRIKSPKFDNKMFLSCRLIRKRRPNHFHLYVSIVNERKKLNMAQLNKYFHFRGFRLPKHWLEVIRLFYFVDTNDD